jgi:DNA-binding GntR family transcriptional regulator
MQDASGTAKPRTRPEAGDTTVARAHTSGASLGGDLTSSVELVYQRTRRAILTGDYPPGSHLRLQELAATNGVSMIPVREALRLLEAEGFVDTIPNRGARVAPLSVDDLRDVYRTRIVLEVEALRQALPRITRAHLAKARRLNARLVNQFARHGYATYDDHRAFHFLLYEPSGSRWLLRLIGIVWDHTERYRRQGAPFVAGELAGEEHERIIAAVEAGDCDGACHALYAHLEDSADLIAQALTRAEADSKPPSQADSGV